ncbi:MAG: 50S ribosomal protein L6 [Candidatus Aenigmarchaeota archaeon]|nr:50S ribosomal protein L6 [Candidatus Aenigmarchaeota archaeon]
MEKRVNIPNDVSVEVKGKIITVKGSKGHLERDFSDPRFDKKISIEKTGDEIVVSGPDDRKMKAMIGTIISHIKNMAAGAEHMHTYKMKIIYTHFPVTVEAKDGKVLVRNFLGERGVRVAKIIGKTEVKVSKDDITISSISKEDAGQTAANIEKSCKLSKRDRRIFIDGIFMQGYKKR